MIPIRGINVNLKSADELTDKSKSYSVSGKGSKQAKSKQDINYKDFLALLAGSIDFASVTKQQAQPETSKVSDSKQGSVTQLQTTLQSVLGKHALAGNSALLTILEQLEQNQASDQAPTFAQTTGEASKLESVIAQLLKDLNGNLQAGTGSLQKNDNGKTGMVDQIAIPQNKVLLKNVPSATTGEMSSDPKAVQEIGASQSGDQSAQASNKSDRPVVLTLASTDKGMGSLSNTAGQQPGQTEPNQANGDKTVLSSLTNGPNGDAQQSSKSVPQVSNVVAGHATEGNHHSEDDSGDSAPASTQVAGAAGSYYNQADQRILVKERSVIPQIFSHLSQQLTNPKSDVSQLSIQLHPAELGKIEIAVRWEDGKLHIQCQASQPETSNSLQQGLPELKQALEGMGIACGSMQMGMGGQAYQQRQPQAPNLIPLKVSDNEAWTPLQSDQLMITPVAVASGRVNLVV